ncbi:MAG TPA: endonuclease/exonuclease/phosphatase family protein [Lacipirellulaceae bacterium]|nr:endonuclease/exonuclease/phosphatase family protein [Lacipirellulaceae bacterium]
MALCGRLLVGILLAIAFALPGRAELPAELRVLTYNIHHGEGVDGKFDLPRIAEVIKSASPDLVALQEVDQGTARASGVDQPAELARLTGMEVVFGQNIDFEGGGYGTAVLSRLPVKAHSSVKLRSFYEGTDDQPEQRGVQILEIGEPGEAGLVFLCTHLDYRPDERERMASAETINDLAAKYGERLMILAGDLNAVPDSRVMREFAKRWTIAGADAKTPLGRELGAERQAAGSAVKVRTFPSGEPVKWIDYVLVRPAARWEVVEVRVIEERIASDHRPLLAVLRRMP